MDEEKNPLPAPQDDYELGMTAGKQFAFGMVAGRCTAAQAACWRKIREEKKYLKLAPTWAEFCARHLKVSKSTADRYIALLNKHGARFFEAAALTGISPAEYEQIAPHIQADGIHEGDEVIALIPENAQRAIEAVAKLQEEAKAAEPEKSAPSTESLIEALERRGEQLCAGFHKLAPHSQGAARRRLFGAIKQMQHLFYRLETDLQ